ncbi:MAG: formimidoylglutamate deiminase [Sediminimonas qiaohouensis]|uniref:Formimidoylglutamate deiminase n=1 Tax=Sediminimonas qiaohouensis TaxID=552061 RepID=A0A7C9HHC8_9RHOB|nr:formimidoylglutamate deiminase [Sediminimonas qiaohouensis]MTJ03292.1 formimidoylglutamate deiminase [Sediminimonas qiaohouensis]
MNQVLHAATALLPDGWHADVRIEIGADGHITAVTPGAPAEGLRIGPALSAPANLHSHAFQRAMAGLSERRGPDPRDSFWTWRRLMFRFLDQLTPDDVQAIAAFVQMEMLESGFASVAEFHYLHHAPGGAGYDDPAEMAGRICAAAAQTGIGLTLLPVLYQVGGRDGRALGPGQVRFGNDVDGFARLMAAARPALDALPRDARMGVAPHSLRAVTDDGLHAATAMAGIGPIHMHLAEQTAEVEEVQAATGARPVEHLFAQVPVDDRWCLIHCTQIEPHERDMLARSGAVAGLCPITESSLGDGIFDGVAYADAGGRFGIGSDSNIRISLPEEMRTLEYSQRLRDRGRAMLASADHSTGRRIFDIAAAGGAQAAARGTGTIAPGQWADLLALNADATDLIGRSGDTLLDTFMTCGDTRMVAHVWSAGRHVVEDGAHPRRAAITRAYRDTLTRLKDAL